MTLSRRSPVSLIHSNNKPINVLMCVFMRKGVGGAPLHHNPPTHDSDSAPTPPNQTRLSNIKNPGKIQQSWETCGHNMMRISSAVCFQMDFSLAQEASLWEGDELCSFPGSLCVCWYLMASNSCSKYAAAASRAPPVKYSVFRHHESEPKADIIPP